MKKLNCLKFLLLILFLTGLGAESRPMTFRPKAASDIIVSVEKKDASAESSKDGEIHLTVSGGVPPYKVHIFSPYTFPYEKEGNDLMLENIGSGDYLFVIQDKSGATVSKEVKIGNSR